MKASDELEEDVELNSPFYVFFSPGAQMTRRPVLPENVLHA